jgi:hypothetical protein
MSEFTRNTFKIWLPIQYLSGKNGKAWMLQTGTDTN